MTRFAFSIVAVLALGSYAKAEQRHALHGLFCNTEEQIDQTLTHMRGGLPLWSAANMTNGDEVVCVYADRIHYVITSPAVIGEAWLDGLMLQKYEATLVGVLVGGNLRPVEPSVQIFFVRGDRLPGAVVMGGA